MDTVDAPLRRWGSKTGGWCGWGLGGEGGKVWRSLSTAPSASDERCREVLRALGTRGLQTPGTLTTEGAPGVRKAVAMRWPRALRMRCWFHQRPQLPQQVPPQAWPACNALGAARREAPTCAEGPRRWPHLRPQSQAPGPAACRCLEEETAARLTPRKVPARHPPYVRTSHLAARACEAERRRPTVRPQLWDAASWVQRVCAGLMRVSERWGKKQVSECEPHHSRALRHA